MKVKKMIKLNILTTAMACLCLLPCWSKGLKANFSVRVEDGTTGKPLVGVKVGCVFENLPTDWSGGEDANEEYVKVSDKHGCCRFKGRTNKAEVYCVRMEPEHYSTEWGIPFARVEADERLIPEYATTTIRVERIEHPIPLFVKEVECGFPEGSDSVSFDMLKADWLPPKGTGEVADVVVTRLPRRSLGYVSLKDGRSGEAYEDVLRVEFPGEGNGIREVTPLKGCDLLVRQAPLEGYERFWEERWGRDLKFDLISTESLDRCQCFRIRAHKDADGKCVGGYYGKIYEGFSFSGPGVPKGAMAIDSFSYTYFLNPAAGDRNLEFNGKNLNPETRHVLWRNR